MKRYSGGRGAGESLSPGRDSRRILIVDDDANSATCLEAIVKLWGYESRTANQGVQAISEVSDFRPDVVLLDIDLPGMDGYAVAEALRQDSSLASLVLIAMTGYGQPADIQRALDAGFDRHFLKPLELGALQACLAEVLRIAQGR
jgi:two-component system, OmpR family, response regulator